MDSVLVGAVLANLLITSVLLLKFIGLRKSIKSVKVIYFPETSDVTGFMKKQKRIQIKAQLFVGDIPVGHPFVISEQITESVDTEKMNLIIEHLAKPLAALGIKVLSKGAL